jgi:flagellar basal-body rod modification protein FlgD
MPIPLLPALGAVVPSVVGAIKNAVAPNPTLGKDDFLKLLVAQLKHQDPLKPLDNSQFIAQTATFSSLEELQNIRKSLESFVGNAGSSAVASATPFLGRPVVATSAGFTFAGATVSLPYALEAPVGNAAAEIMDAGGNVVGRVPIGARTPGQHTLDLTPGMLGKTLPAGQYRYRIVSREADGRSVPLPAIAGTVTGVSTEGGAAVLAVGSRRIALGDIVSVGAATN